MAIIVETVRQFYEAGYRIYGWCIHCRKSVPEVSLSRLIGRGVADKPLAKIRIRHGCGHRLGFVVAPPTGYDPRPTRKAIIVELRPRGKTRGAKEE